MSFHGKLEELISDANKAALTYEASLPRHKLALTEAEEQFAADSVQVADAKDMLAHSHLSIRMWNDKVNLLSKAYDLKI